MKWLPRCAAWSALLAGSVGVLLCLVLLVGVWLLRVRLDETIVAAHTRVDVALANVQALSHAATDRVLETRIAAERLNRRIREKTARLRGVPESEAADLVELERRLRVGIETGRDFFQVVESSVDLIEQLVTIVRSSAHLVQDKPETAGELLSTIRAGKQELEKAQALIDQLGVQTAEFRAGRDVDRQVREIDLLSKRIHKTLTVVEDYSQRFSRKIDEVRQELAVLAERIHLALFRATIALTVLLLWSAAAQACLAIQGRQFLRRTAS